ncbi:hypothetical protein GGI12_003021 [Dipsacomyces acuminosporus]|nr:hypothetical protein GGI12_003021 [Dipsacomyces acuminosporus]
MHFNGLAYDILRQIFAIVTKEYEHWDDDSWDLKRLLDISSVCRVWRAHVLPHICKKLVIEYSNSGTRSNASFILAGGYVEHARALEVRVNNRAADSIDLVAKLDEAGVGKAAWSCINELVIKNNYSWFENGQARGVKGTASAMKQAVEYLFKHAPNITRLGYEHKGAGGIGRGRTNEYTYLLASKLVNRYSPQLRKLALSLAGDRLPNSLSFPRQLTLLNISMGGHEHQISATIFAPSLECLTITNASPDITWSWFDSGDGNDVWFSSLKQLSIEFDSAAETYGQSYHSGNLTAIDTSNFKSDYRATAKRAHFVALEKLAIVCYPYTDGSFYELFKGCPLKDINIELPQGLDYHIPPQLLANLANLHIEIDYYYLEFQTGDEDDSPLAKKEVYERAIAELLSSPSTANAVNLVVNEIHTFSLAGSMAWNSVRVLELGLYVDMPSIYAVLAHMPKLQHLVCRMSDRYLDTACDNSGSAVDPKNRQLPVVNQSVEYISLYLADDSGFPDRGLPQCLSNLLPLVPSLLKLKVNYDLVDAARGFLSDPSSSLEWMSKQLEII